MNTHSKNVEAETFWNGEPAVARQVMVLVGDKGTFPEYWAREEGLVGTVQPAVEVKYGDQVFYLDDREGAGWAKVTTGMGSPRHGHRDFEVDAVTDRT